MTMCLIGDPEDLTATYVRWRAMRRGIDMLVLAENTLGASWSFGLERDGRGHIDAAGGRHDFSDIQGAIVRLNPKPELPDGITLDDAELNVFTVERRHGLHWLLDTASFPVCNRPYAGRSNGSKPFQMQHLARAGFSIPRWVATNEPERVAELAGCVANGVIYKACSGLRSHVRRVDEALSERLREGTAPVLVQEYIPGTEVRIHVVGRRTFSVEVRSAAVDYRFDGAECEYLTREAPAEIARRCIDVAAHEGLMLAGFDFRCAPDGVWYCLEVNPVPTFLPYEAATGVPIADAVLDELLERNALRH